VKKPLVYIYRKYQKGSPGFSPMPTSISAVANMIPEKMFLSPPAYLR
jgi:hypothetical protein